MSDPDSTTPPLKTCTQCGREHPATLDYFHARAGSKLTAWCKECNRERVRAWRAANVERVATYNRSWRVDNPEYHPAYRDTNREKIAEQDRAYYASHVDERAAYGRAYNAANSEKRAEYSRAYRVANREKISERFRGYRAANPEKIAENRRAYYAGHVDECAAYCRAYRVAHPESVAAGNNNRRARKLGNGGTHTADDVRAQYARQNGRCFWCEKKLDKYHVDHVMPLMLGGSNGPENLVVACPTCNLSKGAKHPQEFAGRLL